MQLSKFPLAFLVVNFILLHKWTCVRALLGHVVPVAIPTNCPSPYPQPEPTTALILTLSPSPEPTTAMMFLLCTGRVHSFLNTRLCVCVCVCVCVRARAFGCNCYAARVGSRWGLPPPLVSEFVLEAASAQPADASKPTATVPKLPLRTCAHVISAWVSIVLLDPNT